MTNKIDKLIEALIEDIDTTKLWRLCFNKMTNSAKRQMINEMLNLIIGSAYPINGPIFSKIKDEINSSDKDVEDIGKLRVELAQAKVEENGKECISIVGCRDRYRKEYEELKNELDLYKTWYRAKHGDVKNILGRYYKALEEIENNINKYFEESFYKSCRYAKGCTSACGLATNNVFNQILNIINKAKGEE